MSWQHLKDSEHVARKTHRCIWCNETIAVGEKYRTRTGVMEGDFQSNRWHLECIHIADAEYFACGEESFEPGSFQRGTTKERRADALAEKARKG